MQRMITAMLAFAVAGLASGLVVSPAAAADKPTCGLNNGKAATGEPIQLGAVVGKTGPADFSSPAQAADAYFKCVNKNGGIAAGLLEAAALQLHGRMLLCVAKTIPIIDDLSGRTSRLTRRQLEYSAV